MDEPNSRSLDKAAPTNPRYNNGFRSSTGCWICRLRRKKCDEVRPVCEGCSTLSLDCEYSEEKPHWMDGARQQELKASEVKAKIKDFAGNRPRRPQKQLRTSRRPDHAPSSPSPPGMATTGQNCSPMPPQDLNRTSGSLAAAISFPDVVLTTFYLDDAFPLLFPFYKTSTQEGGKSWILEFMHHSPVVRDVMLCQSRYFRAILTGQCGSDAAWSSVLEGAQDAFRMLRKALAYVESQDIREHLPGCSRILAGILLAQRFEVSVSNFDNCQGHLDAATGLFSAMIDCVVTQSGCPATRVPLLIELVKKEATDAQFSAEQVAFRFSLSLLVADDILGSIALGRQPTLSTFHWSLLGGYLENESYLKGLLDLQHVLGCPNWILSCLADIAMLVGVRRSHRNDEANMSSMTASRVRERLKGGLNELGSGQASDSAWQTPSPTFPAPGDPIPADPQNLTAAQIWAEAVLIYLHVAVADSSAAPEILRLHVDHVLELVSRIFPATLCRSLAWPICIAGCLADNSQRPRFQIIVQSLQPPAAFGPLHKGLEIVQTIWRERDKQDSALDFSSYLGGPESLVLLL